MGLKRGDVFKSNYLGQADLPASPNGKIDGDPIAVVIKHAEMEEINGDGGKESKAVLHFDRDKLKPMILNSGNWQTIEEAYGEDTDAWVGNPIEVFIDPKVMYGGKKVGGVRVRIPSSGSAPSALTAPKADPGAGGPTFGPAWAAALDTKVAEVKAKFPNAGMLALRDYLLASVDGANATVIHGSPMNWPRAWMDECKVWLAMDHTEAAAAAGGAPDDDIPF